MRVSSVGCSKGRHLKYRGVALIVEAALGLLRGAGERPVAVLSDVAGLPAFVFGDEVRQHVAVVQVVGGQIATVDDRANELIALDDDAAGRVVVLEQKVVHDLEQVVGDRGRDGGAKIIGGDGAGLSHWRTFHVSTVFYSNHTWRSAFESTVEQSLAGNWSDSVGLCASSERCTVDGEHCL